ncbi:MAG: hypothetical protein QM723_37985 [Myxococcaceae bacterium]
MIGGVLARAARLTKVELCGFVATSTHVHLLCRARDGALSTFMQFFLCNLSKKAGPLVDWRGQLWERRYAAEPVLDNAALDRRLRYILAHGVKEGLVRKVSEWPGLSCLQQLLGSPKRVFPFYSWAQRWKSGELVEGGDRPWGAQWATDEELELHPLPHWVPLNVAQRRARVRAMVADIEAEGLRTHRNVLGADRVVAQDPHSRPARPDRRRRPWFHTTEPMFGREYMGRYRRFVRDFKIAVRRLQRGKCLLLKLIEFPTYSCAPHVFIRA